MSRLPLLPLAALLVLCCTRQAAGARPQPADSLSPTAGAAAGAAAGAEAHRRSLRFEDADPIFVTPEVGAGSSSSALARTSQARASARLWSAAQPAPRPSLALPPPLAATPPGRHLQMIRGEDPISKSVASIAAASCAQVGGGRACEGRCAAPPHRTCRPRQTLSRPGRLCTLGTAGGAGGLQQGARGRGRSPGLLLRAVRRGLHARPLRPAHPALRLRRRLLPLLRPAHTCAAGGGGCDAGGADRPAEAARWVYDRAALPPTCRPRPPRHPAPGSDRNAPTPPSPPAAEDAATTVGSCCGAQGAACRPCLGGNCTAGVDLLDLNGAPDPATGAIGYCDKTLAGACCNC